MDRQYLLLPEEVQTLRRHTQQWESDDIRRGHRQGPLAWMLVDFALSTGLRVGEIAAVRVSDIDIKNGYCAVIRLKKRKKTGRLKPDGKPEWEPVRTRESLKLDKDLVSHLREYLDWRALTNRNTLFTSLWIGKRGPMSTQGLEVLWKRAAILAGLTTTNPITGKTVARYSIHKARHTLATALAKSNPKLAQRQCGHSSVATTLNMYCHVTDAEMGEALDKVKAGMNGS
jgi:integrase